MAKKTFICITTGEVIRRLTRASAVRYFKRDGKKVGYEPRVWDAVQWALFRNQIIAFNLKERRKIEKKVAEIKVKMGWVL